MFGVGLPRLGPPQNKLTKQQAGRALAVKGAKGRGGGGGGGGGSGSGGGGDSGREKANLVLDLGNHAQETITDMQRNFVQARKKTKTLSFVCV